MQSISRPRPWAGVANNYIIILVALNYINGGVKQLHGSCGTTLKCTGEIAARGGIILPQPIG